VGPSSEGPFFLAADFLGFGVSRQRGYAGMARDPESRAARSGHNWDVAIGRPERADSGLRTVTISARPSGGSAAEEPDPTTRFHRAMVGIYQAARRDAGYNATYFLRMVSEQGGLAAARNLLRAVKPSEGFTALWERGRLDLTVEALVLRPDFEELFSPDELDAARDRLAEYGFEPPAGGAGQ